MMQSVMVRDRETFLQFRREWKTVYNFISAEIRTVKREQAGLPNCLSGHKRRTKLQIDAALMRNRARHMMAELAEAKSRRPL